MQTADIAMLVSADLSGRFSQLRSAPAQMIFFQHPLTAPLPLMPFFAHSAPFSALLTCSASSNRVAVSILTLFKCSVINGQFCDERTFMGSS